jgi:hypothetical protein
VQVARLVKALRLAEAAIELGELKLGAAYLRIAPPKGARPFELRKSAFKPLKSLRRSQDYGRR